jgi:enterochelin esterase-like enzyme
MRVLIIALLVSGVAGPVSAGQNPQRFGTWTLDIAKSTFDPGPPPMSQRRIEQLLGNRMRTVEGVDARDGTTLTVTSKGTNAAGQRTNVTIWTRTAEAGQPSAAPVVSPEAHADGRVTFRLFAPQARTVMVQGEFGPSRVPERVPMMSNGSGVWSATVGPLAPAPYRYTFAVDGTTVVDPRNPLTVPGNASIQSMVVVPGTASDLSSDAAVAHGAVRAISYQSALGTTRRMHVYTPPGYDKSSESYPVLYLIHGASGNDAQWSTIGRAGFILDNLLAAGRARPMIVVMPDAHIPGAPADRLPLAAEDDKFALDFQRAIVPYVEQQLRVRRGAGSRAIAGLSMGGAQTLLIVLSQPRAFGYVGLFSAAWWPEDLVTVERRHRAVLDDPRAFADVKLWIGVGTDDRPAFPNTQALRAMLGRHKIEHTYRETDGDHTWINWRRYFNEFATLLFRQS